MLLWHGLTWLDASVYGMGLDLITILAIMGTVGVGDPLSLTPGFSIGGPSKKVSNVLGNLFGLLGGYCLRVTAS